MSKVKTTSESFKERKFIIFFSFFVLFLLAVENSCSVELGMFFHNLETCCYHDVDATVTLIRYGLRIAVHWIIHCNSHI